MDEMIQHIDGWGKLIKLFGCWPEFHDAEIMTLHLWRGYIKAGEWDDGNVLPVLTVGIRILQAVQKEQKNELDILATLRFHDVGDFCMEGFNNINQIVGFSIHMKNRGTFTNGEPLPPLFVVSFDEGFGMKATFSCFRIEVLNAEPATEESLNGVCRKMDSEASPE